MNAVDLSYNSYSNSDDEKKEKKVGVLEGWMRAIAKQTDKDYKSAMEELIKCKEELSLIMDIERKEQDKERDSRGNSSKRKHTDTDDSITSSYSKITSADDAGAETQVLMGAKDVVPRQVSNVSAISTSTFGEEDLMTDVSRQVSNISNLSEDFVHVDAAAKEGSDSDLQSENNNLDSNSPPKHKKRKSDEDNPFARRQIRPAWGSALRAKKTATSDQGEGNG